MEPRRGAGALNLLAMSSETMSRTQDQEVRPTIIVRGKVRQYRLRHAAGQGTTTRSIILRLPSNTGIADVDEADLIDCRSISGRSRKVAV